jgi:hypothetical protein
VATVSVRVTVLAQATISGVGTASATGFQSFKFVASEYERQRVVFVAQEKLRRVAVPVEKARIVYVRQEIQRIAKAA